MRFLCFHGMGTNTQIMQSQTASLRHELDPVHTYDFVEGTVLAPLASELVHLFHNYNDSNSENTEKTEAKYYNYFLGPNNDNLSPQSFEKSFTKALSDLDTFLAQEGPYEGAIAFSQGGILVATYLIQQRLANPQKPLPFKCAIFLSSGIPWDPRALVADDDERIRNPKQAMRQLDPKVDGNALLAGFPTAHIWGRNDDFCPGTSEVMSQLCDPMFRNEFIHDEGHEVPPARARDAVLGCVRTIRRTVKMAETLVRK